MLQHAARLLMNIIGSILPKKLLFNKEQKSNAHCPSAINENGGQEWKFILPTACTN
jgi:hypothetical protein